MYSRKIKQMKKKLLSSSNPTSRGAGSASFEVGGSGGGGLNSSWGPRVAIYERELQEQQRRSREEQEQLYMAAKQQEIYNKSKASGSSRSQSDGKGTGVFKNPYATSGIGIHTSNGFICKANKKMMLTSDDNDVRERERPRHKSPAPDKPLRVRIPSPDPHLHAQAHARGRSAVVGAGLAIVGRRRHASPNATNESLASTKTYHSSGGSTHSSSSTLSSRGSHSSIDGRSSLIVGSDHHDSVHDRHGHGHAMVSGNYNINGDDEDEDEEYLGAGQHYGRHHRNRAHNGIGAGKGKGRNSPVLPLPPQSTMSSNHNVKLINVHLISDDEGGGRAALAPISRSKLAAGTGFYSKNIVRGQNQTSTEAAYEKRRVTATENNATTASTAAGSHSKASKLIQGFSMVYVPMESTKARPQERSQEETDDLPITTSHRRRQLVPSSESGYGGFRLPEEEIQHIAVPTVTKPPAPPSSENGLHSSGGGSAGRNTNASSVDADSLLESFDSVLFKPKSSGHGSSFSSRHQNDQGGQQPKPSDTPPDQQRPPLSRKKTPPPLPPKSRRAPPPQSQQTASTSSSAPLQSAAVSTAANANPSKSNKNLRFAEHLDIKAPSPYTTISYEAHAHAQSNGNGNDNTSDSVPASAPSASASGPASRNSVYSACTTTTTLLSCGHLRDSYSTLSSLNSDAFTDENEGGRQGKQDARSTTTAQGDSIDTSIDCPIGDDDDDLDLEKGDDPSSHKSALQQLRDLSILIGGSFHTSPMIQTAVNAATAAAASNGADKYGKTTGTPVPVSDEPAHKNYTKAQIRKFSTETSNDSGKGSATGSGRSRSEAGGSGSGRANSIMQLLQNLPPSQPKQSAEAQRQQKVNKVPVNGNSKSILAALNKIARPPNPNHAHARETVADHHGHGHHQSGHCSTSSCSCSCDDSELSSCLFQPECEECQQVFGNPFEVLPELKYIDSQASRQQQPQPQSQTKHKKIKVLTSKKELTRRNSYKLKSNPAKSRSNASKSKSGPMSSSAPVSSSIEQRQPPKLGYAGIGTKTQLLLSKSAHRDQSGGEIGCLGCYNEQLMLANGGCGANCSPMMMTNMMSPVNLFTIDEAAEENDGTLHSHYTAAAAAAAGASSSSNSKLVRHGTAKTKRSHRNTKYGRGKKKLSSAAKKAHHHHSQHHHQQKCDGKSKYVNGNPKCWLVTDATMGWSDLESIYSQNMKSLDSPGAGNGNGSGGDRSPGRGPDSPNTPSQAQKSQYVNGECVMCWRELMQYKYNNVPAGVMDPSASYTVERTKRMFIWLNRRPKEFSEPWWEAKKQASIKWLVTKAYSHLPKGSVQHPFKESKRDKSKMVLKDQVMAGLATGKLYCMALANLFQDCTPDVRQSIFGSRQPLKETPKNESDDDELLDQSRSRSKSKNCGINLSLSHWEIIKILSRKGIYVAQPSDMKLTEGTLRQRKPFRITAHIALIEAVMGLYAKVMLTRERIEPIVSNLGHELDPDTQTSEEFILAWMNAVIDTLKAYILSTNINNARKQAHAHAHASGSPGSVSSPSSTFSHHRWLNVHPITDLRDLFDGIGFCSLFVLYFSTEVSFDQVCVNEPGETLNIYDSILNLNLAYDLTSQLLPQTIHHLRLTDLLYIHGYMKQNVLQLLLDIFYYTEVVPIDTVSRLTHVPLRIQL